MESFRSKTTLQSDNRAHRSLEAAEVFQADYLAYQYRFVEFFIDHMSDLSRAFRGDLQSVIVLALIGQKYLAAIRVAIVEGLDVQTLPPERMSTSASRIADVTGIPRQSVRRKLAVLEQRGWISQNPDGTYRMVSEQGGTTARRDLSEVDRRALQRVARLFADLEAMISSHQANEISTMRKRRTKT
jgi:predicted transcriptional regulator